MDCDRLWHEHSGCRKMDLGLYSWFAFLETLRRVWGTRFYVWCYVWLEPACLLATPQLLMMVLVRDAMEIVKIYDYKPSLDCEV
jgi:hypothetical protein